jgi:hypothetical protein
MSAVGKSSKELFSLTRMFKKQQLSGKSHLLFTPNLSLPQSTALVQKRDISIEQSLREYGLAGGKFKRKYRADLHSLKAAFTETGAIAELPLWYRYGFLKVTACVVVSVLVGSAISKSFTTFLEENDIFKPEDDDDEDD